QAQSNARHLSWPGRSEAPPAEAGQAPAAMDGRRPNPVIPHGGRASLQPAARGLTPAPGPVRRTLTPANAWLQPAAPEYAPAPVPAPRPAPAPVAVQPSEPAPAPRPVPEYLPDQGGRQP